jgi:hypothetical protein
MADADPARRGRAVLLEARHHVGRTEPQTSDARKRHHCDEATHGMNLAKAQDVVNHSFPWYLQVVYVPTQMKEAVTFADNVIVKLVPLA